MMDRKRVPSVLASFARLVSVLHALPFRTMPVPVRMRRLLPPVLPDRAAAEVAEMPPAQVAGGTDMPPVLAPVLVLPAHGDLGYRGVGAPASGGGSVVVASRGRTSDLLGNAAEQVSRAETGPVVPLTSKFMQRLVLPSAIEGRRASSLSMQSLVADALVLLPRVTMPRQGRSAGAILVPEAGDVRTVSARVGLPWLGRSTPNGSVPVIRSTVAGSFRTQDASLSAADISGGRGGDDLAVGGSALEPVLGFGNALLPGLSVGAALPLPLAGAIGGRSVPAASYVPPPSLASGRNAMPDQQATGRPTASMPACSRATSPAALGADAGAGREMPGGDSNVQMAGSVMMDGRQVGRASAGAIFHDASLPLSAQSRPNIRNTPVYTGMRIPQ